MGYDTEGRLLARLASLSRIAPDHWYTFDLTGTQFRLLSEVGPRHSDASYILVTYQSKSYIQDLDGLIQELSVAVDGARKPWFISLSSPVCPLTALVCTAVKLKAGQRKKQTKKLWSQALALELSAYHKATGVEPPSPRAVDKLQNYVYSVWSMLSQLFRSINDYQKLLPTSPCLHQGDLDTRLRAAQHSAQKQRRIAVLGGDPV